jgi:hypothetical protein
MYQSALNRSRNDKFILILDLPMALKSKYESILDDNFKADSLQFSIYGSPVPSVVVPAIDVPFGGQVHKTSSMSRPSYDPLSIKFLVDNGYKNYWVIWKWINLFNDAKKSSSDITNTLNPVQSSYTKDPTIINPLSKYVSNFTIYGLDEFNNKIISFSYKNVFPTGLSELNFSNQDPSEINSTVTFVFDQLDVEIIKNVDQINC